MSKPTFEADAYYSAKDVADRLNIARQTLANYRHFRRHKGEAKGPRFCKVGGVVRYRGSDILDWMKPDPMTAAA